MVLQTFPFNGTNGAALTTGNTGANSLTVSAGCTANFASAAAYQGSTGAEFTIGASGFSNATFTLPSSATQASFSIRLKIPAAIPPAAVAFLQINDTTGTRILQLQYTASGVVKTNDKGNTGIIMLTTAQATAGSWFRIEVVLSALSATTGAYTARAYTSGSTQIGTTATSTTANLGTTNINGATIGCTVSGAAMTLDLDSLQMNGGSTAEIGEYNPNSTPPSITAGANQTVTPGTATNLTCSATAQNGDSIVGYTWSLVSAVDNTGATITGVTITNPTSQTASFTPAAGKFGRYIFGVTATDSSGNTSTQTTTRVFVPGTSICPIEVTSNTGWLTTTVGYVQDATDTTYLESGAVGSGGVLVLRLAPLQQATSGFSLTVRSLVQTVGGSQTVELLEGATVRKSWGALAPGTSFADQPLSLTTGEMGSIGSWNELDLRLTQV